MLPATLLKALLSTTPDLVWIQNAGGSLLACNPTFERLTGVGEERIVGQPAAAFFAADLADHLRAAAQQIVATAQPLASERWLTLSDGAAPGLFQLMGAPIREADGSLFAVLWVARDITDIQRTQAALRESEARYRALFEDITQRKEAEAELGRYRQQLEELVAERTAALEAANSRLRRSDRRLQSMLELSQRMNDLSEADLLQIAIDEVVALTGSAVGYLHFMSDDQQTIELCCWSAGARQLCAAAYDTHYPLESAGVWADSVRSGAPVIHNDYPSLEGRRGYPAGHVALERHLGVPVLEAGKVRLLLGVGNKPTDYDAADARELELIGGGLWRIVMRRRAQAALEQARDAAEAANVAKSAFLASMSHELRTPLNAILGRAELLGEGCYGPVTEQQQAALRDIQASGGQLLALFNDVLDLSQVEAGQIELACGPVEVEAICGGALRAVYASAAAKQISLTVSVDGKVAIIACDGRRLKQVLVHLLRNGVKFTPAGGKVGLEVAGDRERELVTFTVWDTGIGIAQEDLPGLFKPFVQLDSRLSRQYEGAGIGLALVARLVRLHGGSVTVESRPGEGSRFAVMLPWREG